ncbi:MAG: HAMP domain-containing sensor histidine kinase [Betaproteobacteria bacterium]
MRRLVPDSLFGRIMLTFIGGLVLTMAVSLLVQYSDREAFVFRASAGPGARRVADLVKLLDRLPVEQQPALLAIAQAQGVNVELRPAGAAALPAPVPGDADAQAMEALLVERLPAGRHVAVAVTRRRLDATPPGAVGEWSERFAFDVDAELANGTVARFSLEEPRRFPRWPTRTLKNLAVMLVMAVILSFVVVRWVTRPLKGLADAADQLGRDIHRAPVPETGPQEVRRAAHAFNTMQERLARYVHTRTAILAAMSHDLKTPITRLRLRTEMLDEPALRDKFLRDLDAMQRMVGTTLDYMRGLDDHEPLCAIDVDAMLEALRADAEELGHRVALTGIATAPFEGKPQGLRRIVQNLLDNALHYASEVEIAVDDRPEALVVAVRDRGPGIPDAMLEKVFEPFHRLEASRNPGTGGTGLGLSIARNLAQAMGGDVTVANRGGGGLEACVALPRGAHA